MSAQTEPKAQWYIVYVRSKTEDFVINKIKFLAEAKFKDKMSEHFEEFFIPKLTTPSNQSVAFPGYILIKMFLTNEAVSIVKNSTTNVRGFLTYQNDKPKPLSEKEYQDILLSLTKVEQESLDGIFAIDDVVRINSGSFKEFDGTVTDVDNENSKLKIKIKIFGSDVDIDLSFSDVEKKRN